MRIVLGNLLLLVWSITFARADVVIFKNGDRLTGALVDVQRGVLTLKSDVLGNLMIPLNQVQSFSADRSAVVLTSDRKAMEGQLELLSSGEWQLTKNGQSQSIPVEEVSLALPAEPYHDLIKRSGKPWRLWTGAANFGYSIQNGAQQTNSLNMTVNAVRQLPANLLPSHEWRTNYGLTMLFSKAAEQEISVSSKTLSTNLRQDYLFSSRDFVFGFAQLDHIAPQGLYLRQTLGFGFGRDLVQSSRTRVSILGGLNYLHEKFDDGFSDDSSEVRAGGTFGMQINDWLRYEHNLNFYPNLKSGGQYHADTNANLGLTITSRLTLNTGVIDLYLSNPGPGSRRNSIAFTTGIGFTFGR